jgi:DNA invertase Pin-like site-specific DNA recombinase
MHGVYVRVSSYDQNPESQERELQRWLYSQCVFPDDVRWFIDKASGKDLDRPAFDELQTAIFHGEIDTVVVWKLDRLSRSLVDGINVLADWCERDLRIVSVTQQLDFNGAMGKMLAAILLGVAEMERENIRERQAAGIAAAKQRGMYKGRKRGTTNGSPTRAAELRAKGLTVAEIAASLGVSARTAKRYLASV